MGSMRYYHIFVAEVSYQKPEPLTYASEEVLPPGTLVKVPYGKKQVPGFVAAETDRPAFATKPVSAVLGGIPLPEESRQLFAWLNGYYPGSSGALAQAFVPSGVLTKPRSKPESRAAAARPLPALTRLQQDAVSAIRTSASRTFLLHGETGSGKTRVYLELIIQSLQSGKSALLLAPEISLIPQLEAEVRAHIDAKAVVMHSGLTKSMRTRNWLDILSSEKPLVVIGTRSALFAPIKQLGLIVVDEMHEPAYKQESAPRYYGLRVAARAAKLHGAQIIYGSATPPVVEYFVAAQTSTPILRMDKTARPTGAVKRSVIDLKDTKLFARHRSISDPLLEAIGKRLAGGEQTLLFLNRRGTARQILCQACGWQALCPHCDIPLTYHGDDHTMRCHICAYRTAPPYACPVCASDDITYRSLGTKALVDALHNLFPQALVRRFDTDNLAAEQLIKHFDDVRAGNVDILVGTQMLGKGLDLPKLSLVGIINADTSLGVPDFSSAERSYQLLHQAIGRVGRGHIGGEVIVQTFNPASPLLAAALSQDWHKLYEQELAERKLYGFPPFYFLAKISVSRKSSATAEAFIGKLHARARSLGFKLQINEPAPGFYEKTHGRYNWQMVVKAKQRGELVRLVTALPKGDWTFDLDPINLL